MSTVTAPANPYHGTTPTSAAVDVITLPQPYPLLEITNWDTSSDLWVTVDTGPANQNQTTPTVGGQGCYRIGPGGTRVIADDRAAPIGATIPASVARLASSAPVGYTITGLTS